MKRLHFLATVAASLALSGCTNDDNPVSQLRVPTVVVFAPSAGDIPVPNDLLYSGSTDATLNIPVANPLDPTDPLVALNALDGWSTSAPLTIRFSRNIDMATVIAGASVRLFDVQTLTTPTLPVGGPVIGVNSELVAGTDYSIAPATEYPGTTAFRILLEAPLLASTAAQKHNYMVVVTNAIRDTSGFRVSEDQEYFIATSDEVNLFDPNTSLGALQQLLLAMEFSAAAAGVNRSEIVLTMSFTTQSVGSALGATLAIANGQEMAVIASVCAGIPNGCADTSLNAFSTATAAAGPTPIGTTATLLGAGPGFANVFVGSLRSPYYQTAATNPTFAGLVADPTPLQNFWRARYPFTASDTTRNLTRFNPLPVATGAENFPLLITVPNMASGQTMPMGGWPVVIFQHGITRNRTDVLPVADALAAAGFVCISMDLPMHGLSAASPLFLGYQSGMLRERTFGLDLINNTTGASGPDGVVDSSGQWFMNLANLLNTRDNIQQAVTDLFNLRRLIGTFTVGGAPLDPTRVEFLGHSLGGIVGTPFLALVSGIDAAVLAEPGAGLPYLLDGSPNFSPVVQAGLAAAGVFPGTPDYTSFLFAAQTAVDASDPINFGAALAATGMPLLLHEVIGGGPGGGLPDQTIPNTVASWPLAGTEPLISALGLAPITMTESNISGVSGAVRFIEGDHASLLLPTASAAATAEMQTQIASFLATVGTQVTVTNTAVIDTNP